MIRDVLENDIEQIKDIYNYYILNTNITFEEDILSKDQMRERINDIKKHFPYIVYEDGGIVLGYAYLNYYSTRSAYWPSCDLSIYVKNDFVGKSIGKKLYEEIEIKAKKYNFKKILSCITLTNEKSIAFHKHYGFKECGVVKNVGFKNNEWLSIIWMDKDI